MQPINRESLTGDARISSLSIKYTTSRQKKGQNCCIFEKSSYRFSFPQQYHLAPSFFESQCSKSALLASQLCSQALQAAKPLRGLPQYLRVNLHHDKVHDSCR